MINSKYIERQQQSVFANNSTMGPNASTFGVVLPERELELDYENLAEM